MLSQELHDAFSAGVTLWELLGNEWLPDLPNKHRAMDVLAALTAISIAELEGPAGELSMSSREMLVGFRLQSSFCVRQGLQSSRS